jgi:hypothetical protein
MFRLPLSRSLFCARRRADAASAQRPCTRDFAASGVLPATPTIGFDTKPRHYQLASAPRSLPASLICVDAALAAGACDPASTLRSWPALVIVPGRCARYHARDCGCSLCSRPKADDLGFDAVLAAKVMDMGFNAVLGWRAAIILPPARAACRRQ